MEQEDKLDFQTEPLPLREFAVFTISSHIWSLHLTNVKKPLIDAKIMGRIKCPMVGSSWHQFKAEEEPYLDEMKVRIINSALKKSNNTCLPKAVTNAIQTKVLEQCDQIHDWMMYVMEDLNLPTTYVDKIYFTSKGNIDVSRIFRSHWIKIPVVIPNGWFFKKFNLLHCLACLFDTEYLIRHFQIDIIYEIKAICPGFKIDQNSDRVNRIISIVIYCYKVFLEGKDLKFINVDKLKETNLTDIKMLEICRSYGFYKPFTYFYNQLTPITEQNYLERISKLNFGPFFYQFKYGRENAFQIAVFVLNKMNDAQKQNFILQNFNFLFFKFFRKGMFLKFCTRLLDKILLEDWRGHFNRYRFIFKVSFEMLERNEKSGHDPRPQWKVLDWLMRRIPKESKSIIFTPDNFTLLGDIYNGTCYIPALRFIMNDPDLKEHRIKMIHNFKPLLQTAIEKKDYKRIDKFVVEILASKSDHDEFNKLLLDIIQVYVEKSQFYYVDNYLNWKYEDRAQEFKIKLYPLWCSSVQKYLIEIEKLFFWYFGQTMPKFTDLHLDHEIIIFKRFLRELIYNIWFRRNLKESVKYLTTTISQILSSIFISEIEISNFKKYELAKDESCVRFFCDNALKTTSESNFELVSDFLNICGLSNDEVGNIKLLIANDLDEWIVTYGVSVNRYDIVVPLLDWIYGKADENRKILEEFFCPVGLCLYYACREKQQAL